VNEPINITLLLRKPWRTGEGVARVEKNAASLGLEVTTSGRVSVSAKASPQVFERLFGFVPTQVAAQPPGNRDFGAPGGYTAERELPIPVELSEYVETISVMPPAQRYH